MQDDLDALRAQTIDGIEAASDVRALEALRVGVLGKSGTLTGLLKELGKISPDERRAR
jgi:phenylalanyl-tRNA synthetase alpha chain